MPAVYDWQEWQGRGQAAGVERLNAQSVSRRQYSDTSAPAGHARPTPTLYTAHQVGVAEGAAHLHSKPAGHVLVASNQQTETLQEAGRKSPPAACNLHHSRSQQVAPTRNQVAALACQVGGVRRHVASLVVGVHRLVQPHHLLRPLAVVACEWQRKGTVCQMRVPCTAAAVARTGVFGSELQPTNSAGASRHDHQAAP